MPQHPIEPPVSPAARRCNSGCPPCFSSLPAASSGPPNSTIDNVAMLPHTTSVSLEAALTGNDIFRQQARVLKALANESRLQIVDRLARGECSVGELTDLVGSDRTTISKHLAILRAHGIVHDRREGNVVFSSDIANAKIMYKGKGEMTNGTKPNVIARVLGWLF